MRALAFALLGLLIGAAATVSMMNALRASTAYPNGVMALLSRHMGQARELAAGQNCPARTAEHIEALAVLARDIEPAFLPIGEHEEQFVRYAQDLRTAAEAARSVDLANCAAVKEAVAKIGDGCKACHRDFK